MNKTVTVKNLVLGQGKPKICVPITAVSEADAVKELTYIRGNCMDCVDLAEIRIDFLQRVRDKDVLYKMLCSARNILGEIPLLCTLRTLREGGNLAVTENEYEEILINCINSEIIDMIDVEIYMGESVFERVCETAKKKEVRVLASNHDFAKTPPKDELVSRLMKMESLGADIAKIAVMPKDREDVMELLSALSIANTCMDIPMTAISMGKLGAVSRLCGECFGSCITFGVGKRASAPGQISAQMLKEILNVL